MTDNIETATPVGTQDIVATLEERLYGTPEKESQDDVEDVSDDAEELPEDDQADSEDEDSEVDLENIAEEEDLTLADYLGIGEDKVVVGDDGSVSINAVIDGEVKPVSLKDLVSSHQLQGHVNNKSIALENERKEFEDIRTKTAEGIQNKIQEVSAYGKAMEDSLVQDYNSIDWDALRAADPGEWTALRQMYSERAQGLQTMQSKILNQNKQLMQEQYDEHQKALTGRLQNELNLMIQDDPTWADPVKRAESQGEIKSFLNTNYGFTDEEFADVVDHRVLKVIRDAQAYRNGSKTAETKKEKRVPKFRKPGATKSNAAQTAKARSVKAKRTAVKNSNGNVRDIANLLVDRM